MSLSSLFAPTSPNLTSKLFDEFGFDFTTPSIILEPATSSGSNAQQQPQLSDFLSENFTNGLSSFLDVPSNHSSVGKGVSSDPSQSFISPPQSRSSSLDGNVQMSRRAPGFALTLSSISSAPPSPALSLRSEISLKTNYSDLSANLLSINTTFPPTIPENYQFLRTSASQVSSTGMATEFDFSDFGHDFDDMLNIDPEILSLNIDELVAGLTESPTQISPTDSEISPTNSDVPSLSGYSVASSISPLTATDVRFDPFSIPIINIPLSSSPPVNSSSTGEQIQPTLSRKVTHIPNIAPSLSAPSSAPSIIRQNNSTPSVLNPPSTSTPFTNQIWLPASPSPLIPPHQSP
ncbi:hypothetical protein BC829DRAFT_102243 [Chytridium lagenaria]|nr:hypothetical protein BC829DRAFT_102243 [Chytridium lagenaria]